MEFLEITRNVLLVLHFVGIGALLGGVLTQMRAMKSGTARIVPAVMHGAWTMLATGLLLVGIAYPMGNGEYVDNAKIAVKLAVLVAIVVIALVNKKKETVAKWVIPVLSLLTIVNIVIAVFW
jgi:hypothetical protein